MKLERIKRGACVRIPYGNFVYCENNYDCNRCQIADRIRANLRQNKTEYPLFGYRDALPQTPRGGGENWYGKPVILSPEAMDRLGLERYLENQIFVAVTGPGVFKKNVAGEIDGYLFADPDRQFTVTRMECFGIPSLRACTYYDDKYFRGLSLICGYVENRRKGW